MQDICIIPGKIRKQDIALIAALPLVILPQVDFEAVAVERHALALLRCGVVVLQVLFQQRS